MTPTHTPTASAPLGSATPDRRVVGKAGRPYRYTNCRPIPHHHLVAIFRELGEVANGAEVVDLDDYYAERIQAEQPTTLQRIASALGSDRIIPLYLAFVSGSFFTLGMAIIWARLS